MPRYRSSVAVPVPVAEGFAFVSDFTNAARWDPRVERAEKRTPGPVRPGTLFVLVSRFLGREVELPYRVERMEAPEAAAPEGRLVLAGASRLLRYRDDIGFEPAPDGTHLTYDAVLSLRGPFALGNPILALLLPRIGDDAVAGIARSLQAWWETWRRAEAEMAAAGADAPPLPDLSRGVTPEAVHRIVALEERPILRNLLITLAYHRISADLARKLGGADANWCTVGAWASKTAGTFIREEELRAELRRLLERRSRLRRRLRSRLRRLHRAVAAAVADGELPPVTLEEAEDLGPVLETVAEVGRYIREGNRTVFEELGGLFAAFLAELADHPEPDPEALEAFLARLRPGGPEPDAVERRDGRVVGRPRGGQDLLARSVRAYYGALFEEDPDRRSELILLANALGGVHEQTRLQGYVAAGLEAPVAEVLYSRQNDALLQRLGRQALGPRAQAAFHRHFAPLGEEVAELARELSTRLLMEMRIPGEVLRLGEDLPLPPSGAARSRAPWPPALARIDSPELAEVLALYPPAAGIRARLRSGVHALLVRLGLRRAAIVGTAAGDWGELSDRMRYILALFRSRQSEATLFEPPFDPEQTGAILAGRVPRGAL